MVKRHFDYEEKYENMQEKLKELMKLSDDLQFDLKKELTVINSKLEDIRDNKYRNLEPWEKVLLSRHPQRPTTIQYIESIFDQWLELHGDRAFGDDPAVVGGLALFKGIPVTVLGHQKGRDTNENIRRNFGMSQPEGYRKVKRLLLQARKFKRPVISFIGTPGAHPGVAAEERGQAIAIAEVLITMAALPVPIISVVIGEGGSGGALALAVSDRLLMLTNTVFSVASAEACSSIIWKDPGRAEEMASYLKLTPEDLLEQNIIDEIIDEPVGGAHQDFASTAENLKRAISSHLFELIGEDGRGLVEKRYQKLRKIGEYKE